MTKRDYIDIIADILEAIERGITSKSGIMKNVNLSTKVANKYIKILINKGLINNVDGRYTITEKGISALQLLTKLRKLEVEIAELHLLLSEIL